MPEPTLSSQTPVSLKGTDELLMIEWRDGVTHSLKWSILREACPCASCRMKRSEPPQPEVLLPVIKPEEARPIRMTEMKPIGNYAYGITFSDGHNTGIYSLEYLRQLGEEAAAG